VLGVMCYKRKFCEQATASALSDDGALSRL